jgi:ABC-type Fe3+/spermidine/putrescine transport system ATPase subunit
MRKHGAELILDRLSFQFGKDLVVDDLSLAIPAGEFLSLLGPSGCGKTTILRLIAGLLTPTAGTLEVDGKAMSSVSGVVSPDRRGMSMIFQNYALWPHMTVAGNVAFGLKLRPAGAEAIKAGVLEALETVRLAGLKDRYPSDLSGGQQQRVALARAIALKPSILLFDEPLSNLDTSLRDEMRDEIRRTHDAFGMTSIYVTHDHSEAMSISDRIAILNKGRIEQLDAPQDLYERPKTAFAANFLGKTNILRGHSTAAGLLLNGFPVPFGVHALPELPPGLITFSIRPQNIRISVTSSSNGAQSAEGLIVNRRYLGGSWEYQVRLKGSSEMLRVLSPENDVFSTGDEISAVLDLNKIVLLGDI